MTRAEWRIAIVSLLLVAACSRSDSPTAPALDILTRPRFDTQFDCQLSFDQCQAIQRGITMMKNHPNVMCQNYGALAQQRYDAISGEGYRSQPQYPNMDMSVYYNPWDGYTNVYPSFWTNPYIGQDLATGALIAHEEYHHQGNTDENMANAVQSACLNWQA